MLGDKQQQTTESGSTALQAGRDINIRGLSVGEVRELCILFLRDNFPQLREEAKRTAEEQVRAFAAGLESRLANDAASIALVLSSFILFSLHHLLSYKRQNIKGLP